MKINRLAIIAAAALAGCSTIGQDVTQDAATIAQRNTSPSTLTQVDAEGTWAVNTPGPVRQTTLTTAQGEISTIGGGVGGREVVIPIEGAPVLARSDSDISLEIGKLNSPTTGVTVAENVRLTTRTTEPTDASVRGLAEFGIYAKSRDAAQVERDRVAIEALRDSAPGLYNLLLRVLVPTP